MGRVGKFISYTDQVYELLKKEIISGKFPENELLQERSIAENLGVSRTPVREALKKLEFEGWVETIPWKGVIVKGIHEQDVIEVFQCRFANERFVLETITPIIEDSHLQVLEGIHEKMKTHIDGSNEEFIHEDHAFHNYLARLTNNKRLCQFIDNLSEQMIRLGIRLVENSNRKEEALKEHEAILIALRNRLAEDAVKAIKIHLENSQSILLENVKESSSEGENK
ncbi:GntR family transcriptional regulator [Alkalihalophilus lindianensis]|uniref:GntR family transcriptional regulator n=1 Tax=Alkalihalophilus lindianensis TaxID=1630542 RepID=A0ABU3XDY0_9BACI|nr:GntR family transcriptional regulator [Alkalihalophilus lindianensis]MDV2686038.1 GntR family transcriptional regulator [Alkalihalophilus lindianensis]